MAELKALRRYLQQAQDSRPRRVSIRKQLSARLLAGRRVPHADVPALEDLSSSLQIQLFLGGILEVRLGGVARHRASARLLFDALL